jgi:uncharacterized membrane protein
MSLPSPSQLSRELRLGDTPDLRRRRSVVGLSMVGAAAGIVVSLYQTGVIRHLPDPPLQLFDSDKVDASDYAYKRAQTPDGLAMLVTYAVTALLAGAGGKTRARSLPWLPLALAAKVAADVATNLTLAREEWADNKALCAYCQAASVASLASLPLVLPEARTALRHLLGR